MQGQNHASNKIAAQGGWQNRLLQSWRQSCEHSQTPRKCALPRPVGGKQVLKGTQTATNAKSTLIRAACNRECPDLTHADQRQAAIL